MQKSLTCPEFRDHLEAAIYAAIKKTVTDLCGDFSYGHYLKIDQKFTGQTRRDFDLLNFQLSLNIYEDSALQAYLNDDTPDSRLWDSVVDNMPGINT